MPTTREGDRQAYVGAPRPSSLAPPRASRGPHRVAKGRRAVAQVEPRPDAAGSRAFAGPRPTSNDPPLPDSMLVAIRPALRARHAGQRASSSGRKVDPGANARARRAGLAVASTPVTTLQRLGTRLELPRLAFDVSRRTESAPVRVEEANRRMESAPVRVEEASRRAESAPIRVEQATQHAESAPMLLEQAPRCVASTPIRVEEARGSRNGLQAAYSPAAVSVYGSSGSPPGWPATFTVGVGRISAR